MNKEEEKREEARYKESVKKLKSDLDQIAYRVKEFNIDKHSEKSLRYFDEHFFDVSEDIIYWGYGTQRALISIAKKKNGCYYKKFKNRFGQCK